MCRYAEDCAIVMQAVAKPDGRDMSVSDVPFNWNAQLDVRKLRVGYIKESFDEITNPTVKANAAAVLDTLTLARRARVHPDDDSGDVHQRQRDQRRVRRRIFDEFARAGRMKEARGGGRPTGRLTSRR